MAADQSKRRYCGGCQQYRDPGEFYFSGHRCKECSRKKAIDYRNANLAVYQKRERERGKDPERMEARRRQESRRRERLKAAKYIADLKAGAEVSFLCACSG